MCDCPNKEFTSPACEEPAEGTREIRQRCLRPPALGIRNIPRSRLLLLDGVEAGVISQSHTSAQGTPGYRGARIPSPCNRQARGCHGDRLATPTAWLNCCLRPNPGKMLRGGCKASERRKHLIDRLSWQQDQALSSSIYLLREMGPTAFLLREEEPENRDFRVTTAPSSPRLPARRTRPVPPDPPCM